MVNFENVLVIVMMVVMLPMTGVVIILFHSYRPFGFLSKFIVFVLGSLNLLLYHGIMQNFIEVSDMWTWAPSQI